MARSKMSEANAECINRMLGSLVRGLMFWLGSHRVVEVYCVSVRIW